MKERDGRKGKGLEKKSFIRVKREGGGGGRGEGGGDMAKKLNEWDK